MEHDEHVAQLDQLVPDPEEESKDVYRIGDLAREFGVTLRTLRFYEDRGLIKPEREGSTRLYSKRERARLKIILLAKQVGFSLVDINDLMKIYDKGDRMDDPLSEVLEKFIEQVEVMERQREEVDAAIVKLHETIGKLREMRRK